MQNFILENQWIIWLAIVWTIPWKGMALWKAARNSDKAWFIILLVFNTLAILEIIYIFIFSKRKESYPKTETEDTPSNNGDNLIRSL